MAKSNVSLKRRIKKNKYTKKRIVHDNVNGGGVLDKMKSSVNKFTSNTVGFATGIAKSKYAITMLFNPSNIDRLVLKNHYFSDFLDHDEIKKRLYPGIPIEYNTKSKRFQYKEGTDIANIAKTHIQNQTIYNEFVQPAKDIVANNNAIMMTTENENTNITDIAFQPQFNVSNMFVVVCIYMELKAIIDSSIKLNRDNTLSYLTKLQSVLPIKTGDNTGWTNIDNFNKYISNVNIGEGENLTIYTFTSDMFNTLMEAKIDINDDGEKTTLQDEYSIIVANNDEAEMYFKSLDEMKTTSQLKNAMNKLMNKMKMSGGLTESGLTESGLTESGLTEGGLDGTPEQCAEIAKLQEEYNLIEKQLRDLINESKCNITLPDLTQSSTIVTNETSNSVSNESININQVNEVENNTLDNVDIKVDAKKEDEEEDDETEEEEDEEEDKKNEKEETDKIPVIITEVNANNTQTTNDIQTNEGKKANQITEATDVTITANLELLKTSIKQITSIVETNKKGGEPQKDNTIVRLTDRLGTAVGTVSAKYNDLEQYYNSVDYIRVDDAGLVDLYIYNNTKYAKDMLVKFQDKYEVFFRYLHLFKYQLKRVFWTATPFSALGNLIYLIKTQNIMLLNNPRLLDKYQKNAVAFFKAVATTRMINPMNSVQLDEYTKLVTQGKEVEISNHLEQNIKNEDTNNDDNADVIGDVTTTNANTVDNTATNIASTIVNTDVNDPNSNNDVQDGGLLTLTTDYTSLRIYRKLKKYFDVKEPFTNINVKDTVFTPKYPQYAEMEAKYTVVLAISILNQAGKDKSDAEKRRIDVTNTVNTYIENGIDVSINGLAYKLSKPNMLLNLNLSDTTNTNDEIKTFNQRIEAAVLYDLVKELKKYDYSSLTSVFSRARSRQSKTGGKSKITLKNTLSNVRSLFGSKKNALTTANGDNISNTTESSPENSSIINDDNNNDVNSNNDNNNDTNNVNGVEDEDDDANISDKPNLNLVRQTGVRRLSVEDEDDDANISDKPNLNLVRQTGVRELSVNDVSISTSDAAQNTQKNDKTGLFSKVGKMFTRKKRTGNTTPISGNLFYTNLNILFELGYQHMVKRIINQMTIIGFNQSSRPESESENKKDTKLISLTYETKTKPSGSELANTSAIKTEATQDDLVDFLGQTILNASLMPGQICMGLLTNILAVARVYSYHCYLSMYVTTSLYYHSSILDKENSSKIQNILSDNLYGPIPNDYKYTLTELYNASNNPNCESISEIGTNTKLDDMYNTEKQGDREKRLKLYLSHSNNYQFKINGDFVGKINSIEVNVKNLVDIKKQPYDVKTEIDGLDEVSTQFEDVFVLYTSSVLGGKRTDFNTITTKNGKTQAYKHNIQPLVKYTYSKNNEKFNVKTLKDVQDNLKTTDSDSEDYFTSIINTPEIFVYKGEVVGKMLEYRQEKSTIENLKFYKKEIDKRVNIYIKFEHKTVKLTDYYPAGREIVDTNSTINPIHSESDMNSVDDTFTSDKVPLPPISNPAECYFYIVEPDYKTDCPNP